MSITFPRAPRLLAALATTAATLACVLAGTASAAPNTFCNPPSGTGTTTYTGPDNGQWGDGDNWSDGQPSAQCDAVIPANTTVTLGQVTLPGSYGGGSSGSAANLTVMPGATLIIEGISDDSQGNADNATNLSVTSLNVDQGATIDLEATGNADPSTPSGARPGGSANLTVDTGSSGPATATNDGTINASSSDAAWGTSFNDGGTFNSAGSVNDQSGLLTFQGQNYPYVVNNTGSVAIAAGASFTMIAGDGSQFINPAGATFANNGSATLSQTMHWIQSGGTESGNPVDMTGPEVLEDSGGPGAFEVTNCTVAGLTGTIPANQTISVIGACAGTTLNFGDQTNAANVSNYGTIDLQAPAGGSDAILQGSELDNYGTITSTVGGAAPLANQVLDPLVNEPGGSINLTGGELAQTAGTTTSNNSSVTLGPGASWLVQGGDFTNAGTITTQLASATNAGQFNVTAQGAFTMGGTLTPSPVSGYAPATGTEIPVINFGGGRVSGAFGAVTNGFNPDYSKETGGSPYVGVIYNATAPVTTTPTTTTAPVTTTPVTAPVTSPVTTTPFTTQAPPAPKPKLDRLSGGAGKVTVTLSCAKGKSCAKYTVTATITEIAKGRKKSVTLGSTSGSVKAGTSATVTLKLNRAGAALLKKEHRIRVKVAITAGGRTISTKTVTVAEAKAKPKRRK